MKKGAWVVVAVAGLGLVAAGVLFGPKLYERYFAKTTPLGKVTRLEDAGVAGGDGRRFWAVHFQPKPTAGEAEGKAEVFSESSIDLSQPRFPAMPQLGGKPDPMRSAFLIDDSGEKHPAMQAKGKLLTQPVEGNPDSVTLHFRVERLIFSLPQDRRPRSLQVADTPPVSLPSPS